MRGTSSKRAKTYKVIAKFTDGRGDQIVPAASYNAAHDARRQLEKFHTRLAVVEIIDKTGRKIWPRASRVTL